MKWFAVWGGILLVSGCVTPKKNTELELRVAELEALVQKLEQESLSQSSKNLKSVERVDGLVQSLQQLNESITFLPESKGPQPKPDKATFADLKVIETTADISHKAYSKREKKDGARIEKRLEMENPELASNLTLLGNPLPQTRFIGPDGGVFDLNDFKGKKNVLLVIMRGFSGQVCVACSAQTAILAKTVKQFEDRNTQIIIIYPGSPSSVPVFLQAIKDLAYSFKLPFPILLDINLAAVKKFNIEGKLAQPTSIILDQSGLVQFAYAGKRYDDRPPVRTLLHELDRIQKIKPSTSSSP